MLSTQEQNDILAKVGDTPLKEPELFKAFDERTLKKSVLLSKVLERAELPLDRLADMDATAVAAFYYEIARKITDFKDAEGAFKTTPATESFRLPNFMELEDLADKSEEMAKATTSEDRVACLTALDDMIWKITKLKKDELTVWEQELVMEQIFACLRDVEETSMGKPSAMSSMAGISIPRS